MHTYVMQYIDLYCTTAKAGHFPYLHLQEVGHDNIIYAGQAREHEHHYRGQCHYIVDQGHYRPSLRPRQIIPSKSLFPASIIFLLLPEKVSSDQGQVSLSLAKPSEKERHRGGGGGLRMPLLALDWSRTEQSKQVP